jgi:hypothetical protein
MTIDSVFVKRRNRGAAGFCGLWQGRGEQVTPPAPNGFYILRVTGF